MKTIIKPHYAGKTWDVIELAREDFSYIVCTNRQEVARVWKIIREKEYNLPQPITFQEFLSGQFYSPGIKSFVIDNIDLCIQSISPVSIKAVTITGHEDIASSSKEVSK